MESVRLAYYTSGNVESAIYLSIPVLVHNSLSGWTAYWLLRKTPHCAVIITFIFIIIY
jgi:hypothetical protein